MVCGVEMNSCRPFRIIVMAQLSNLASVFCPGYGCFAISERCSSWRVLLLGVLVTSTQLGFRSQRCSSTEVLCNI